MLHLQRQSGRTYGRLLAQLLAVVVGWGNASLPLHAQAIAEERELDRLVRQLNHDQSSRRDEAERALIELAPADDAAASAELLRRLPNPVDGMPEEVKLRLRRIRRQIETQQAKRTVGASNVTLSAVRMSLAEVLGAVAEQTGNKLVDYRQQFGQATPPLEITLGLENESFWPAIDQILDDADLDIYPFAGAEALALVNREAGSAPRTGRACYLGPFRLEPTNVVAQRGLRSPQRQSLRVELEIAWEPRLRPIALSHPLDTLQVTDDDGTPVEASSSGSVLGVEVPTGSHATELQLPLKLPSRGAESLASLRGELSALVPGRTVEFRFDDLSTANNVGQTQGGVEVTLLRARRNQALWEVHMQLQVNSEETALESHRGWVFQNITFLESAQGEVIEHAGFETTMQTNREVGLAYFFDLPDDIDNYTWVYRTPAAIVRVPLQYELHDIPLP